jgi:hypothetical protein
MDISTAIGMMLPHGKFRYCLKLAIRNYCISMHDKIYGNYEREEMILFYRNNEILDLCTLFQYYNKKKG